MAKEADIARGYLPYNEEAEWLKVRYAETPFPDRHPHFKPFYPEAPAHVLDVGAGIGVDSLGFADLGHHVVAVEPAQAMRAIARAERDHAGITWIDDHLPDLTKVVALGCGFDFTLLSASFMHLPPKTQQRGFETLSLLCNPGGVVAMSLRHGPVPEGRSMYEIPDEAAMVMAANAGLKTCVSESGSGRKQQTGVTWSSFVFRKA